MGINTELFAYRSEARTALLTAKRQAWVEEVETPALVTLELLGCGWWARDWRKLHIDTRYNRQKSLEKLVGAALTEQQRLGRITDANQETT